MQIVKEYLSRLNRARIEKRRARLARRGVRKYLYHLPLGQRGPTEALGVFGEAAKYDAPAPEFEDGFSDAPPAHLLAKLVCFYLPQFHEIDENNKWWGAGFTEWRNVSRAVPRFEGHYQPRVPRDLGYYNLNDAETMRRQARMARAAGISAFSFYYYNFDGRRILEKPVERFLADSSIDIDFCITWANENWTRRWDGMDQDVLLEQLFSPECERDFAMDVCRHFRDARYIRIDGRPLFIVYRPGIIPNFPDWLSRFRNYCSEISENPYILMVQGFGTNDPREFGVDGAVEFPPHKLLHYIHPVQPKNVFDPAFCGNYYDYDELVSASCSEVAPEFDLVKCVIPGWDNEARKPGRGLGFVAGSPVKYESWLAQAIKMARARPLAGKCPFVFINAWNEWAEGAYLEPDVHYGHAYLNATRRAVTGTTLARSATAVLLVGHDALSHGAQLLLLNTARELSEGLGCRVAVCLLDDGPLKQQYAKVAPTFVVSPGSPDWEQRLMLESTALLGTQFSAICNTTVTGLVTPLLKKKGVPVISLIHEMPNFIRERRLHVIGEMISDHADAVVFPSELVRDAFVAEVKKPKGTPLVRPQGIYQDLDQPRRSRALICEEWGIPSESKIVLNAGYGDLRKGLDLFIKIAELVVSQRRDIYFVWIGKFDANLHHWLEQDLKRAPVSGRVIFPGYLEAPQEYIEAADVFALTSREDPFPSVVLEALALGVPVVGYDGVGGHCELLANAANGQLVDPFAVGAFAEALLRQIDLDTAQDRVGRSSLNREKFGFKDYVYDLLNLVHPAMRKISVVVTSYNQQRYVHERLASIFAQSYPIYEILVIDDCSSDDTLEQARLTASEFRRRIEVKSCKVNSGSAFCNWRAAVAQAKGDYVWIAEADDIADPDFLRRMVGCMESEHIFAFSDSRQIDSDGKALGDSYGCYLSSIDDSFFRQGGDVDGREFLLKYLSVKNCILNVSSVLFNRDALHNALMAFEADIIKFKLAGDWRLYIALLAAQPGKVSYLAAPLNVHRRHDRQGVTSTLSHERHLNEIQQIHTVLGREIVDADLLESIRSRQVKYCEELLVQFGGHVPSHHKSMED